MRPRFQQFTRERQYLHNVTPATLLWYAHSLEWMPSESPTQEELNALVVKMRERGITPGGVNCRARAINAYLKWAGSSCKIPRLKEPQRVLPTFTEQQIRRLVTWKPKRQPQRRLHLLVLMLLDTGCRISEALTLRVRSIDLDNLLVTLDGKGDKQRVVPFSFDLRKAFFRYISDFERKPDSLLLASRNETAMQYRNALRCVKNLCIRLGFDPPARTLHAFRHTFAVNYLRRGGSVFHLQKVLGHSTLEMTRRYANLMTEDLQAVHERVSLLSSR
jgi:integrase/recombinase XerD